VPFDLQTFATHRLHQEVEITVQKKPNIMNSVSVRNKRGTKVIKSKLIDVKPTYFQLSTVSTSDNVANQSCPKFFFNNVCNPWIVVNGLIFPSSANRRNNYREHYSFREIHALPKNDSKLIGVGTEYPEEVSRFNTKSGMQLGYLKKA